MQADIPQAALEGSVCLVRGRDAMKIRVSKN